MPEVPPDVIELFFHYLNAMKDAKKDLKSCSLVSHMWCTIARPLLFSNISIYSEEGVTDPIAKLMIRSPHLTGCIDRFRIYGRIYENCQATNDVARIIAERNLRALDLWWTIPNSLKRVEVHSSIITILPHLLSSTRITSISLRNICTFPASLFYHCSVLQELSLTSCKFVETDGPPSTMSLKAATKPKLRSLTLDHVTRICPYQEMQILEWFMQPYSPFDLSELKLFLNTKGFIERYEVFDRFIQTVGQSLEVLWLDPMHLFMGETSILRPSAIARLKSLRFLTISLRLTDPMAPTRVRFILDYVVNFLSKLPVPECLTQLTLECCFTHPVAGQKGMDLWMLGWEGLEEILLRPPFANLKKVSIVCDGEKDDASYKDLKCDLEDAFLFDYTVMRSRRLLLSIERRTSTRFPEVWST